MISSVNLSIKKICEAMLHSKKTVAMTGAGISTASGIHGFDDPAGPWRGYASAKMTLEYFQINPNYLWTMIHAFLLERERAKPNPAHQALVDLENMGMLAAVITQNLDGLHQKAGNRNVLEFYGGLTHCYCLDCGFRIVMDSSFLRRLVSEKGQNLKVPTCELCGGVMLPEIPLHDTALDLKNILAVENLAFSANLMLILGTALQMGPIGLLPNITKRNGGIVAIVNDSTTTFDDKADLICQGKVKVTLPMIVNIVKERRKITLH